MQNWEYTTLISNAKQQLEWTDAQEDNLSASERLNKLGEEGWELVSVVHAASAFAKNHHRPSFRRAVCFTR